MKYVALLSILIGTANQLWAAQFAITDLGAFAPTGINSSGQVVGLVSYDSPAPGTTPTTATYRPYLYDGQLHDLSPVVGANDTFNAINDNGEIIGQAIDGPTFGAFIYRGGSGVASLQSLADPQAGWGTLYNAFSINNAGQIAGYGAHNGGTRAFVLDSHTGAIQDLGTFGGRDSSASGINQQGWVVGDAELPFDEIHRTNISHALLYDGSLHDLGILGEPSPGFGYSSATAINSNGLVVGRSSTDLGLAHAFLYDGTMHDLGTLHDQEESYATDINSSGQIIGLSGQSVFFYDRGTGMVDLNTLIDPALGWHLFSATSINDAGQIVGSGSINGEGHAYLLTPLPEPSAILLISSALLLLAANKSLRTLARG
jgi:probable HAF family extracellular repeat protein